MSRDEILKLFICRVPVTRTHMFCWFVTEACAGRVHPMLDGLVTALNVIDTADSGYASMMIDRISNIPGIGKAQWEQLLQVLGEIYVAEGAAQLADQSMHGKRMFHREPGSRRDKNPEFEFCIHGTWCAIEVKVPSLVDFAIIRQRTGIQLVSRMPEPWGKPPFSKIVTLPRDNPVKDFLVSAEQKFVTYAKRRPEAWRLLTIVWDDFCNEPISALQNPMAGLFTEHSFFHEKGAPIRFQHIDGVIICRYHHQLVRATRNEPLVDGVKIPLHYYHPGFPYKAFIQNPHGRAVPSSIISALNAEVAADLALVAAEYNPIDWVLWIPSAKSIKSR